MIITMNQFLQNPTGSGSANVARRDIIIANLTERYRKIIKNKPIEHEVYYDKGDYIFYFKVPSEEFTDEKIFYDVVLQFTPIGKGSSSVVINNYSMKMFSNSPNFMFTYAYVFNKEDLLVDWLKNHLSKLSLTQPPVKRNPNEEFGFEKSVYFSLLYIKEMKLNYKSNIPISNKLDIKGLKKKIVHSEDKLEEYNKLKKKVNAKKKQDKKKEQIKERITNATNSSLIDNARKYIDRGNFFTTKKPIRSTLKKVSPIKKPIRSTIKKK